MDHPEYEPWVAYERAAIEAAVNARLALWARLGLRVRDRSNDLRIARLHASVDRCLKGRA